MEEHSAKRMKGDMEEVSNWVDGVEKVFCSVLSDHQRLYLLVRLISRCSWHLLLQLYQHMVSICEFDFVCLLPDRAVYRLLSYLDGKTLLTACQVSKSWNSIISRNQQLWQNVCSRNAFLIPAEPSAEQLADALYSKRLYLKNTLLVERLTKELPGETISLKGHTDQVGAMFFYKGKLATASDDHTVRIWNCTTGDCLANYSMHSGSIYDIKFDDNFIVTASRDQSAVCWDVSNGTRLQTFIHTGPVFGVDFNTIFDVLITADRNVKIWSFTDGNFLRTLEFKIENTGDVHDVYSPVIVKIWGANGGLFHILACNYLAAIDYEIGSGMTTVEKKDLFIGGDSLHLAGYYADDSSLKVWVEEMVCSSGLTTVSENSFECVNSCGRSLLTKSPITRIIHLPTFIRLPYPPAPVQFLMSGACFDVFVVRDDDEKGWLYVTWHNSEMRHFIINLPESAFHHYDFGIWICETQWLDGISEESLCDRILVAVHTEAHDIELLKLKPSK